VPRFKPWHRFPAPSLRGNFYNNDCVLHFSIAEAISYKINGTALTTTNHFLKSREGNELQKNNADIESIMKKTSTMFRIMH
jgi:hypothetical protein